MQDVSSFFIVIALFLPFISLPFEKHTSYIVFISILAIYDFGLFGNPGTEGLTEALIVSAFIYIIMAIVTDRYQLGFFKTLILLSVIASAIARAWLIEFISNPSLVYAISLLAFVIFIYMVIFKSKTLSR